MKILLHPNSGGIFSYWSYKYYDWSEMNVQDGTNEQPGIIPRALKELFHQASSEGELLTFSMSMLEVYMGSLRDLLVARPTYRAYEPVTRW